MAEWFHYDRLSDGSDYLRWSSLFEFVISQDGSRIAGRPIAKTSWEAFYTYLFGQVLSFALLKKGIEPLHSTTVVTKGEAVSFIGDCGSGKSSLGAAFLHTGHSLLTDDLLVLNEEGNTFFAYPGFPRIKLFPKIAQKLLGKEIKGTPMNNLTRKLIIPLKSSQSYRHSVPLKAIYALTPCATDSQYKRVTIRRLSQRQAFLQMLKNSFNTVVTEPERLKRQFTFFTQIVSKVPIKTLSYPRSLNSLPVVREAILKDLESGDN